MEVERQRCDILGIAEVTCLGVNLYDQDTIKSMGVELVLF